MRLSPEQITAIRKGVALLAGDTARVWLFGLAARVSRSMYGRKVDVLIKAPNLMHLPVRTIALAEGVRL